MRQINKEVTMRFVIALMTIVVPLTMNGDTEPVGYLGLSTQNMSEAMRIAFDVDHGLLVNKVCSGSPAEDAGIEAGDIILKIDDNEIENYEALKNIVRNNPNKRVDVTLLRKGNKVKKIVTLGAKEKSKICIDIPDIPDFHVILGASELEEEIAELHAELDDLRRELEEIKEELR